MQVDIPKVRIIPNDFSWVRARHPAPQLKPDAALVGTSLVEADVVNADAYLGGVEDLIARYGADRYFAHRKEADWKLDQIERMGVQVVRPSLPLEIVSPRGPIGSTIVSSLRQWCTHCRQCWLIPTLRSWSARSRRSGTSPVRRRKPTTSSVASPPQRSAAMACLLWSADRPSHRTDRMKHPRVIAIIPARGRSKEVPGKNLRRVGGRSLVERAVETCHEARLVVGLRQPRSRGDCRERRGCRCNGDHAACRVVHRHRLVGSSAAACPRPADHGRRGAGDTGLRTVHPPSLRPMILIEALSWSFTTTRTRSSRL